MRRSLLCLIFAGSCFATATTFNDYQQWKNAALARPGSYLLTDNFDGGYTPGLDFTPVAGQGVQSVGNGQIINGEWADCVGSYCNFMVNDATYINLNNGGDMYGIWADWKVAESIDGLQVWLMDTGAPVRIAGPAEPYGNGYQEYIGGFGIVSDKPFREILLTSDVGNVNFWMDNLVVADPATAPEPALFAPLGLLLLGLGAWRRSHQAR